MKSLENLIDLGNPAWEMLQEWLRNAKNKVEVLPKNPQDAEKELLCLQVTTKSTIGAVVYETGGILINNGLIRILGSGSAKLDRSLCEWNKGDKPNYLLIADDVMGGYFALNVGGLGNDIGKIHYLPPETLEWENTELGYTDFINWTFNGDIALFYKSFSWNTWEIDIQQVQTNQVFSFFPFLWTKEGKDIEKVNKKIIAIEDGYNATIELQKKLFNNPSFTS
jgi:hypothetical protein